MSRRSLVSASTRGLVLTGAFTIDSLDWYRCLVIICNEDCYCRKYTTGDLAGILEKSFFLAGSRQVEISRRDSCRDMRRKFFPGKIPLGKWATLAGSQRDLGERRESWRDPGEIPIPILQGEDFEKTRARGWKRNRKADGKSYCGGVTR